MTGGGKKLKIQAKEEKMEAKKAAKEQKEAEKEAKRNKKYQKIPCSHEGCSKSTRSVEGSKLWNRCEHCSAFFCRLHKNEYNLHVTHCSLQISNVENIETESV